MKNNEGLTSLNTEIGNQQDVIKAVRIVLTAPEARLSDSEKQILQTILERLTYPSKPRETDIEIAQESNQELRLLSEALEVIENTDQITFTVFGIGNVLAKPGQPTMGGCGFTYNPDIKKLDKIVPSLTRPLDAGPDNSTSEEKNFIENWHTRNINGTIYAICRLPFYPKGNTRYCTDSRGGCTLRSH